MLSFELLTDIGRDVDEYINTQASPIKTAEIMVLCSILNSGITTNVNEKRGL